MSTGRKKTKPAPAIIPDSSSLLDPASARLLTALQAAIEKAVVLTTLDLRLAAMDGLLDTHVRLHKKEAIYSALYARWVSGFLRLGKLRTQEEMETEMGPEPT